jgi:beta-galactosidase
MLPHAGPRTRSWHEVVALGNELDQLQQVTGSRTHAKVAIVFDWSAWWALELDSRPHTGLSYVSIVLSWYKSLWARGYSIDFAHPESDLSQYTLILVPQLYLVSDHGARNIVEAANSGATVVVGYFSGATDSCDRVRAGGYPAPWQELLGLWVEEYRPLVPTQVHPLSGEATGSEWSEHIHLTGAEAVMKYEGGDLNSLPAVTRNQIGIDSVNKTYAWYISTQLDQGSLTHLLTSIAADAGVKPILDAAPPAGVEVAIRENGDSQFLFILNHNNHESVVHIPAGSWTIVNTPLDQQGGEVAEHVTLVAGDVVTLARSKEGK